MDVNYLPYGGSTLFKKWSAIFLFTISWMEIICHIVSTAKEHPLSKTSLTVEKLAGGSWQNEPGRVQENGSKVRSQGADPETF